MELTEEELLQILKLLESSSFDFLQVEWGELKLTATKAGYDLAHSNHPPPKTTPEAIETPAKAQSSTVPEGTVPVKAPMVGTFYRASEPGAPPFVEVGDAVSEETTVGLIEVMKVFSAVKAGVEGTILEACAQNGQFVEYGQALFLVKPQDG
jgi:acetyl-CoA carboxylase biotin carboxyl carrier protein